MSSKVLQLTSIEEKTVEIVVSVKFLVDFLIRMQIQIKERKLRSILRNGLLLVRNVMVSPYLEKKITVL